MQYILLKLPFLFVLLLTADASGSNDNESRENKLGDLTEREFDLDRDRDLGTEPDPFRARGLERGFGTRFKLVVVVIVALLWEPRSAFCLDRDELVGYKFGENGELNWISVGECVWNEKDDLGDDEAEVVGVIVEALSSVLSILFSSFRELISCMSFSTMPSCSFSIQSMAFDVSVNWLGVASPYGCGSGPLLCPISFSGSWVSYEQSTRGFGIEAASRGDTPNEWVLCFCFGLVLSLNGMFVRCTTIR